MTYTELMRRVEEAFGTKKSLLVKGYSSESTGRKSDLEIRLTGPDGYRSLLTACFHAYQESVASNNLVTKKVQADLIQHKVSEDTYLRVVHKIAADWQTRIATPEINSPEDSKIVLAKSGAYWTPKDGAQKVILLNSIKVNEVVSIPGKVYSPFNSAKEDVVARAIFLQNTGFKYLIPRINLTTNKMEDIEIV